MAEALAEAPIKKDRRVIWLMAALGFASGLPYALLAGSLGAWMTNAGVSFATIGVLSWIGLFYAFKFLWAPMFDWLAPPFLTSIGRRRAWMALCQAVIAACLAGMSLNDPRTSILAFAAFAALGAFFSASQDIVIDAWRIETANDRAPLDDLSTQYQLGYRLAGIVGGAVALLLADLWAQPADHAAGWPAIFAGMAVLMALAVLASLAAPEPLLQPHAAPARAIAPETQRLRRMAVIPVALGWLVSAAALLGLMFYMLQPGAGANLGQLRDSATVWILLITIGAPLGVSFWLARKPGVLEIGSGSTHFVDVLFERVLAPLADIVQRYWLWSIPVLLLAMTYRIADSIWGAFAAPFYLAILQHTNSDIALASKMFGVVATLAGIALGGGALALIGRMPTLILGALLAAATNLLYADLAHGGAGTQAFLAATHLGDLLGALLGGFVGAAKALGVTIFDGVRLGESLTQLTAVIIMENLAGGFASAVAIAWLSSIVNKRFAVVQYALLSSLAMLIGVIFRPKIGEYVDAVKDQGLPAQAQRFADVFIFSAWIGMFAVALCALEWWRQAREKTSD
jgi:PAT family beta-lactamase induction signal transducer AmpG